MAQNMLYFSRQHSETFFRYQHEKLKLAYVLIAFASINAPVSLAAPVWSAPKTLSPAKDPNTNDGQQLAINGKSQIVVGWNGLDGAQARIKTLAHGLPGQY